MFKSNLLAKTCPMRRADDKLINHTARIIQERLPPDWRAALTIAPDQPPKLIIKPKRGRAGELSVTALSQPDPRMVAALPEGRGQLVTARYLSPNVRQILAARDTSYVDETGNVRLILDEPGLFVVTSGASANPWPPARRFTLQGDKAGQVVCALAQAALPLGVRELADRACADAGYVSRLLGMLDREAIVDRTKRGQVARVDWRKLLLRWAEDAPLERRAQVTAWIDPRGLGHLWKSLQLATIRYAITGSAAAARLATVAPTRLATLYTEDAEAAARALGLKPAQAGANVLLLQSDDEAVFASARCHEGLRYASLPRVIVDLLTGPGRSPAEGEALMDWMTEAEESWRG